MWDGTGEDTIDAFTAVVIIVVVEQLVVSGSDADAAGAGALFALEAGSGGDGRPRRWQAEHLFLLWHRLVILIPRAVQLRVTGCQSGVPT